MEYLPSLRVCDGALITVDASFPLLNDTRLIVQRAVKDGLKIVLLLVNVFESISGGEMELEAASARIFELVGEINDIINTYEASRRNPLPTTLLSFSTGDILIGSLQQKWATSLPRFGATMKPIHNAALPSNTGSAAPKETAAEVLHSFLKPLYRLCKMAEAAGHQDGASKDKLVAVLQKLHVAVDHDAMNNLKGDDLTKHVIGKLFPMRDGILNSVITHIPDCTAAQAVRHKKLFLRAFHIDIVILMPLKTLHRIE
jgi:translation elongation factor EF-G